MELRRYWDVVWRRLWVVLALPLLVGLGSSALFLNRPVSYTARSQVQLALVPPQANDPDIFRYDSYYNYLATEYAVDDLTEVLNGNVFSDAVADTVQAPPFNMPIGKDHMRGAIDVRRKHRKIIFEVTTGHRDWSIAIARAAAVTLQRDSVQYFSRGGSTAKLEAAVLPIDEPLAAYSNRARSLFNVALQTAVALVAGLGLAFLLEYLDNRLRDAAGVRDALGLPVVGQLPRLATAGRGAIVRSGRNGRAPDA